MHEKSRHNAPELSLLAYDLHSILENARTRFPDLNQKRICVYLQRQPTLANVKSSENSASVNIHSVLNHPQTPMEVISFVCLHELLHLRIPAREVDGRTRTHPPEFLEAECSMVPDLPLVWGWIWIVMGDSLRSDSRKEATFVKASWKSLMGVERQSLEWVRQFCGSHPQQGAQAKELYL